MRLKRLNRHAEVRRHKLKQKKKFARGVWHERRSNLKKLEDYYTDEAQTYRWWQSRNRRNGGFEYWQQLYLSGRRRFAKKQTNKTIRAKYRAKLKDAPEDLGAPQGNDYRKEFDYAWTIW